MATWILQETDVNKPKKLRVSSIIKLKIQEVQDLISAAEYVECCSNGNSHCPSNYVVFCCLVKFKVLQHIRKTFGEFVKDAKNTHRQVYNDGGCKLNGWTEAANEGIQEGIGKLLLGTFAENKLKKYLLQEPSEKD